VIRARQRLLGQAREFFDSLGGLYSWDEVTHHEAEDAPNMPNGKRNPLGKFREKVVMSFGEFQLELMSPEEEPPLGRINLYVDNEVQAGGPLDSQVWARVRETIKERCHVSG